MNSCRGYSYYMVLLYNRFLFFMHSVGLFVNCLPELQAYSLHIHVVTVFHDMHSASTLLGGRWPHEIWSEATNFDHIRQNCVHIQIKSRSAILHIFLAVGALLQSLMEWQKQWCSAYHTCDVDRHQIGSGWGWGWVVGGNQWYVVLCSSISSTKCLIPAYLQMSA